MLAEGNFYRSGATSDGYSVYCRACTKDMANARNAAKTPEQKYEKNRRDYEKRKGTAEYRAYQAAYQKAWADKNRDKVREKHRVWSQTYKKKDPEKRRLMNAIHNNRQRAKKRGVLNTFQYIDWVEVLELFGNSCAYCGAKDALLDLDHLVAMHLGGDNAPGNVVPACRLCNAQKSRRTLEDFCKVRGITAERLAEIKAIAAGTSAQPDAIEPACTIDSAAANISKTA